MIISGARRIDYASLGARVLKAAGGFAAAGIGAGDCVGIMLRNDIAFFEAVAGTTGCGGSIVPINWHMKAEEVGYILRDSAAKALVIHADLVAQIADGIPPGVRVLVVPTPPEVAAAYHLTPPYDVQGVLGATDWNTWVDAQPDYAGPLQRGGAMIYTSGTTGVPKGVRRGTPKPEMLAGLDRVGALTYGLKADDNITVLMNGPMYHSAPYSYATMAWRNRCTIVLQPRFDPEDLLRLIEAHRVTHMHMVPTMFVRLLRLPEEVKRKYDLSSLRFIVHGAAPCPPAVKRAMIEWWGPVINEYYGSTETGVPVWHSSAEALAKPGTVGRAITGGIVRIFDADGRALPPGEVGEVYIRQTYLTDFTYHHNDQARADVEREGLVTVGDVGYLDADGYLFLCDRKRDMVISGGVNIYPAEIEQVLIGMPGVKDCAVFGIPDDEYGEALCAAIEPEAGVTLTPEAVRTFLTSHMANYKVPKLVTFHDSLPREDTGKIFKRRLREPYWAGRDRRI